MKIGYKVGDNIALVEDFTLDGIKFKKNLKGTITKTAGILLREFEVKFSNGYSVVVSGKFFRRA